MVTPEHARPLALARPGAVEQDHHGPSSFRVVTVTLPGASSDGLAELLADAWEGERKAAI